MELGEDERLRVVAQDLRFLSMLWDQDVGEESLRRASPIIRTLLVNSELQRAWKAAGFAKEPVVVGSTLDGLLESPHLAGIRYAAAGGARFRGNEMRAGAMFNFAMSPADIATLHAGGVPEATIGLSKYIESAGMIVDGVPIPRRTIVKFVANVCGGVHFGTKQEKKPEETRRYQLLDRARKEFMLLQHPCVYFELLSIGQAVVGSSDVARLVGILGAAET